jgi:ribonuclease-3
MEKNSIIDELYRKLGYSFNKLQLLKVALTHRSSDNVNNERLEFLGDSIVNFVIAEALYHQFPHAQEGELSRWRASLINRETLGELARSFDLGRFLILGQGEIKSGGGQRLSILSCAMESIIGAIYMDSNFEVVRTCILQWYKPLIQSLSHASNHKDPKTQLQEYLQKHHLPLPVYTVEVIEGEAHQQMFTIRCTVEGLRHKALGKGTSRRRAEQAAAEILLGLIKK